METVSQANGGEGFPAGRSGLVGGKTGRAGGRAVAVIQDPSWFGLGLSCQVAAAAAEFPCEILARHRGGEADAKNLMELLNLRVHPGASLGLVAEGSQAEDAIRALSAIIGESH